MRTYHKNKRILSLFPLFGLMTLLPVYSPQNAFGYTYLKPDGLTTININRTINVVLLGFKQGSGPTDLNESTLRSKLEPVFMEPAFDTNGTMITQASVVGSTLRAGINYNIVYPNQAFQDDFFGTLLNMAIGAYGPQYGRPQLDPSTMRAYRYGPQANGECAIPGYIANDDGGKTCIVPTLAFSGNDPILLPITPYQYLYDFLNLPGPNYGSFEPITRLITQNFFIDAPTVEKILAGSLPSIGVDVKNPTIVLINWWSRPECDLSTYPNLAPGCFVDHVYTKENGSDLDTHYNIGSVETVPAFTNGTLPFPYIPMDARSSFNAWGMTSKKDPIDCAGSSCSEARIWFYDTSVVEGWVGNWDITRAELPFTLRRGSLYSSGGKTFRIPPIWEYAQLNPLEAPTNPLEYFTQVNNVMCGSEAYGAYNGGYFKYRDYNDLTKDISRLINEVFVAGFVVHTPVYSPWFLGRARHPDMMQLDINTYDVAGDNADNRLLDTNRLKTLMQQVAPTGPTFSVEKNRLLFEGRAAQVWGTYNEYDWQIQTGVTACGFPTYKEFPGSGFLSTGFNPIPGLIPGKDGMGFDPIMHPGNSLYKNRTFGWAYYDLVNYQEDALFGLDYSYNTNRAIFGYAPLQPLPSDIQGPDIWHLSARGHGVLEGDQGTYGYELPNFIYNMPNSLANPLFLGIALDNGSDGKSFRQTYQFVTTSPDETSVVGLTTTVAHENGHHLGLSHPFDGFFCPNAVNDPLCTQIKTLRSADNHFNWSASLSNSIMGYMFHPATFSQADEDSMASYLMMAYFHNNNGIYGKLVGNPNLSTVTSLLNQADTLSGQSIAAYSNLQNDSAVTLAKQAHKLVLQAADTLGVQVQAPIWQAPYRLPLDVRVKSRQAIRDLKESLAMATDMKSDINADRKGISADSIQKMMKGRTLQQIVTIPAGRTIKMIQK